MTGSMTGQHRLGVLFVHGIGFQQRGQTLLGNGEVLLETLNDWMAGGQDGASDAEPRVEVRETVGFSGEGEDPAHSQVHLRTPTGDEQSWLLAESWWSGSFPAPSFADVARWIALVAPVTVAFHAHRRIGRAFNDLTQGTVRDHERRHFPREEGSTFGEGRAVFISWWRMLHVLLEALVFALSLLLVPVVIVLLTALLAVGVLPNDRARRLVLSVQRVLTGSVGDSFVFLRSPIRGAAIMTQVRRDLAWLQERCDAVAIVAHSQGAAVTHTMLGEVPEDEHPDLLVTYGSGLKKLSEMHSIDSRDRYLTVKAALLTAGLVTLAAGILMLYPLLASPGDATVWQVLQLLTLAVVSMWATAVGTSRTVTSTIEQAPDESPTLSSPRIAIMATFAAVLPWLLLPPPDRPAGWVTLLGLATVLVFIGLLRPPIAIGPAGLRLGGVKRWVDVHTTHDPVPNGAIVETYDDDIVESVETANRWSTAQDHTTYWKNRDGFVVPVVCALARLAGLKLVPEVRALADPGAVAVAAYRRRWRVRTLGSVRLLSDCIAAALVLAGWSTAWPAVGARVLDVALGLLERVPFVTISWMPGAGWRQMAGILVALAVVGAGQQLLGWTWATWDRADTRRFLRREPFRTSEPTAVAFALAVVTLTLVAVWTTARLSPWVTGSWSLVLTLLAGAAIAVAVLDAARRHWWERWARAGSARTVLGTRADFLRGQQWAVDQLRQSAAAGGARPSLLRDPAHFVVEWFHARRLLIVRAFLAREGTQLVQCLAGLRACGMGSTGAHWDVPDDTLNAWLIEILDGASAVHPEAAAAACKQWCIHDFGEAEDAPAEDAPAKDGSPGMSVGGPDRGYGPA